MPPSKPAYDTNWIFSNNSDVHVANHRDWFISFTLFETHFGPGKIKVNGIGNVALPTKNHPSRKGAASQGTLLLRDVLFAPSAMCNILGGPILDDYDVSFGNPGKFTEHKTGRCVGILDRVKLYRLRLRGQTPTQTSLDPSGVYMVHAFWPDKERVSWEECKTLSSSSTLDDDRLDAGGGALPLTTSEKIWLKDNYGNEFKFLRAHGLSIYKDDDREEGRSILRGMMMEETDDDHDDSHGSENSFLRELEENPMSHVADHHFSGNELDWIKAHYQHSGNFLLSHGLKPFEDEDCREGKEIVQGFM